MRNGGSVGGDFSLQRKLEGQKGEGIWKDTWQSKHLSRDPTSQQPPGTDVNKDLPALSTCVSLLSLSVTCSGRSQAQSMLPVSSALWSTSS